MTVQSAPAVTRVRARFVREVAVPAPVVPASQLVSDLEVLMRDPAIGGVVVQGDEITPNPIGLITRQSFAEAMTGRLGYGRPVMLRRPVGDMADWNPLVLAPQTPIAEAADAAMRRTGQRRYDHVVVADQQWALAESAELTRAMVEILALRARHDTLTGLPTRSAMVASVRRRCERAEGGRAVVAVVLVAVRGIGAINARYGQAGGDTVLREVGRRLGAGARPGEEVGRLGGSRFIVLATLPPADPLTVSAEVENLKRTHLAGLMEPSGGVPQAVWPRIDTAVAWTDARVRDVDGLLRAVESQIDGRAQRAGH